LIDFDEKRRRREDTKNNVGLSSNPVDLHPREAAVSIVVPVVLLS